MKIAAWPCGTTYYTWDALNRLSSVSPLNSSGVSQLNQSNIYDPLDRRISKTANSATVNYLYNGPNQDAEVYASYPTWNGATTNPSNLFVQGIAIDRTLARLPLTNNVFQATLDYHANGLGSVGVTTLEGANGAADSVQTDTFFEPWGNAYPPSVGTPVSIDPRWQGREQDESGLYYFRARYYDPGINTKLGGALNNMPIIGRFISRDSIGYSGGLNYYAFANNNPVNYGDPTGKSASSASSVSSTAISFSYAGNSVDLGQLSSAVQNLNVTNNGYQGSSWTYNALLSSNAAAASSSSSLNNVQAALNVAGLVPGLGAPADIANAGISALRGDYTGASLSLAGVFVGGVATGANFANKVDNAVDATTTNAITPGSFSIINWSGYPAGIPMPSNPVNVISGAEYAANRAAANSANRAIHQADPSISPQQIHEIQPVKFGGSPTDPSNKIIVDTSTHYQLNAWWMNQQRYFTSINGQ